MIASRRLTIVALLLAFLGLAIAEPLPDALAQEAARAPTIFDLAIGKPVAEQPADFQEFACGTNGGPPSRPLRGFADFGTCAPEASGLREVQFRYDDEDYYRALAALDEMRAEALQDTRIGDFAILASALFDDGGVLRAVRAVTDDRVSDTARRSAYGMAEYVQRVFGPASSSGVSPWTCTDLPPTDGEQKLGDRLVKQDCRALTPDGRLMTTEARLLRRRGQSLVDPVTNRLRPGLFISTSRMEIFAAGADGAPVLGDVGGTPAPAVAAAPAQPGMPADPVQAFLVGATVNCPKCDLAGADLKRRDLAGADLSGANLAGANLHRALLGGARLDGARLDGADLNVADLKRASLVGADLSGALLYATDASGADLSNAILDGATGEKSRFSGAAMTGVRWQKANLTAASFAGANLTSAKLTGTVLREADLQRATLSGADLTDASFFSARLREANLAGTTAVRTEFLQADLTGAVLANADLTEANLLRARTSGIDMSGATLSGAVMPDGSKQP